MGGMSHGGGCHMVEGTLLERSMHDGKSHFMCKASRWVFSEGKEGGRDVTGRGSCCNGPEARYSPL